MTYAPYAVAGWLFLVGLYGVVTSRNLIHLTVCLMVTQSSTYVLLLAVGYRTNGQAPIITTTVRPSAQFVDPIVQALTLTDVVVSVVIVALILALALDIHDRAGTVDPDEIRELSG